MLRFRAPVFNQIVRSCKTETKPPVRKRTPYLPVAGGGNTVDESTIRRIIERSRPRQLRLDNLPPTISHHELKQVLADHKIEFKKVAKQKGEQRAKIFFNTAEELAAMIAPLCQIQIGSSHVAVAAVAEHIAPEQRHSTKRVEDIIIPLWNQPYDQQINLKVNTLRDILQEASKLLISAMKHPKMPAWQISLRDQYRATAHLDPDKYPLCCPIVEVVEAPKKTEYRNKVAFTIGKDTHNDIVVGFVMGKFSEGISHVADPTTMEISPVDPLANEYRKLIQDYIRTSPLPVVDRLTNSGFWACVEVRTTVSRECSILLQVEPGDYSEEERNREFEGIIQALKDADKLGKASLFWQTSKGSANRDAIKLYGSETITETLHFRDQDLYFKIHPTSFFQPNTSGTEILYQMLGNLVNEVPDVTNVLDLCCGTGSIGIYLSANNPRLKVFGLDIISAAIDNANENVKLNNVVGAKFVNGNVNDFAKISPIAENLTKKGTVAVLDPPRAGVPKSVLVTLRNSDVQRVIFVSCNPKVYVETTFHLCSTGVFKPTAAYLLDMFPHTEQLEGIMVYDRVK